MAKKYNYDPICKKCALNKVCPEMNGSACDNFTDRKEEAYNDKIARRKELHKFYKNIAKRSK